MVARLKQAQVKQSVANSGHWHFFVSISATRRFTCWSIVTFAAVTFRFIDSARRYIPRNWNMPYRESLIFPKVQITFYASETALLCRYTYSTPVHRASLLFFSADGRMCNRDLENLKRWKPDAYLVIERAEVLTPQGVEDMRLLARRLQSNFPRLLQPSSENITAQNYVVYMTTKATKERKTCPFVLSTTKLLLV